MKDEGSETRDRGSAAPNIEMLGCPCLAFETWEGPERFRRLLGPAIICSPPSSPHPPSHPATPAATTSTSISSPGSMRPQRWRHGIFYPHWTPSPNYGAGEPRFVFYPPLTWMLGAALRLDLSLERRPIAITFFFLAATGLATRALARGTSTMGPPRWPDARALFSGFALFTAYERSAFPGIRRRILASAPSAARLRAIAIRSALRLAPRLRRLGHIARPGARRRLALERATRRDGRLSACSRGARSSALLQRSWAPVLRSAIAVALGLGLSAIYWFPPPSSSTGSTSARPPTIPATTLKTAGSSRAMPTPILHCTTSNSDRFPRSAFTMIAIAFLCIFICMASRTAPPTYALVDSPRPYSRSRCSFCSSPSRGQSGICFPRCVFSNSLALA